MNPKIAAAIVSTQDALTRVNVARAAWNDAWTKFNALLGPDKESTPAQIDEARGATAAAYEAFLDRCVEFDKRLKTMQQGKLP